MPHLSPGASLGIAILVAYAAWLFAFFARVRPRVMRALSRRLRVKVTESTDVVDAGTWSADDDAPIAKTGIVLAVDAVVLLLGTVGVAALVFIPAFLVAESGVLLPFENRLTGHSIALRIRAPATMEASSGRATLAFEADNDGREPLRSCRALVDGYASRNGYLHGASPWFDLAVGARVAGAITLEATRPPTGAHAFRVKVECDNERIDVVDTTVTVR